MKKKQQQTFYVFIRLVSSGWSFFPEWYNKIINNYSLTNAQDMFYLKHDQEQKDVEKLRCRRLCIVSVVFFSLLWNVKRTKRKKGREWKEKKEKLFLACVLRQTSERKSEFLTFFNMKNMLFLVLILKMRLNVPSRNKKLSSLYPSNELKN